MSQLKLKLRVFYTDFILQSPFNYRTPDEARPTKRRRVDSNSESEDISDLVWKVVKEELVSNHNIILEEIRALWKEALEEIRALRKEVQELQQSAT